MSGKRINAKVVADFSKQKSKGIKVDSDDFIGQTLGQDIVDTTKQVRYYTKQILFWKRLP